MTADKADVFRNLGETETHTRQREHLPATPSISRAESFPIFPLLWEESSGPHSSCRSEGIGTEGPKPAVAMRDGCGEGRIGSLGLSDVN